MTIILMTQATNPFPSPITDAQRLYDNAVSRLKGSARAKTVIDALQAASEKFYVCPTTESTPMFMHKEWCIEHGLDGGIAAWHPNDSIKVPNGSPGTQDAAVCLLHELGHAHQWLTKREWYTQRVNKIKASGFNLSDKGIKSLRDEVENDNIKENETPVAKQLGQGWRDKYD